MSAISPARAYDAVIFDLLTALLDSWSVWNRAAGSAEAGLAWRRQYLALTYGAGVYRPYLDVVRDAERASGVAPGATDRLLASWDELAPWPEADTVLQHLAARVPLAIVTNCSVALGRVAAARVGRPFDVVLTAEEAGYYKPRAEPYAAALARLGTTPERTLFVAGSAADVPGAHGVGMPVFWHNRLRLAPLERAEPEFEATTLDPLRSLVP
jgi:2-haloacid dehalogenase